MTLTDDQKAALNQLFDEIAQTAKLAEYAAIKSGPESQRRCNSKLDHLRTTFPDRVAEILKPKQSPMTNKEALDILSNTPILFSPHCISGLVENCGCWRCRQDRGEQATPETEERARIRCEEIRKSKEGEELG